MIRVYTGMRQLRVRGYSSGFVRILVTFRDLLVNSDYLLVTFRHLLVNFTDLLVKHLYSIKKAFSSTEMSPNGTESFFG